MPLKEERNFLQRQHIGSFKYVFTMTSPRCCSLKIKKAETFDISLPYDGAVNTINTIYDFVKSYGYTLNIVTNQVTEEAKQKSKIWLDKFGFKYDDIIFVDAAKDKWKFVDIMVDDADKVIGTKPLSKVSIKIIQKWNENTEGDFNIFSINDS